MLGALVAPHVQKRFKRRLQSKSSLPTCATCNSSQYMPLAYRIQLVAQTVHPGPIVQNLGRAASASSEPTQHAQDRQEGMARLPARQNLTQRPRAQPQLRLDAVQYTNELYKSDTVPAEWTTTGGAFGSYLPNGRYHRADGTPAGWIKTILAYVRSDILFYVCRWTLWVDVSAQHTKLASTVWHSLRL